MLAAVLLAVLPTLTQQQTARVDAIVHHVMGDQHIAGLSLGIARAGTVLMLRGYGERAIDTHARADGYTIYRIGSITKQFTAALVLAEQERGTIDLDAPVHSYLTSFPPDTGIAVRQLLAQTSGIAADVGQPLDFDPGTSWAYNNTNYLVLGMLLQQRTHRAYGDLLATRICTPLGLRSSAYGEMPFATNLARGYRWEADHFAAYDGPPEVAQRAFSAAGMSSNVPDLLRWLEGLRTGRVLSTPSFAAMVTSQPLASGMRTHYGYGFFIRNWYGWRVAEHNGAIDGYSADDALVLDDGLELAVLSNADRVDLRPLTKSLLAIVDPPRDANLYANPARPPENEDPGITALVHTLFAQLEHGTIDRARLSPTLNAQLSVVALERLRERLAPLGEPHLVEFIERTRTRVHIVDRYRLSFRDSQWWFTVGYRTDHTIDELTVLPDTD